jgi:hypothetical protein
MLSLLVRSGDDVVVHDTLQGVAGAGVAFSFRPSPRPTVLAFIFAVLHVPCTSFIVPAIAVIAAQVFHGICCVILSCMLWFEHAMKSAVHRLTSCQSQNGYCCTVYSGIIPGATTLSAQPGAQTQRGEPLGTMVSCADRAGKRRICCGVFLIALGAALIVLGGVLPLVVDDMLHGLWAENCHCADPVCQLFPAFRAAEGLYTNFVLDSPNASGFNAWANSSDPDAAQVFMDFYVYNITNVTDLINGGKPRFEEVLDL